MSCVHIGREDRNVGEGGIQEFEKVAKEERAAEEESKWAQANCDMLLTP